MKQVRLRPKHTDDALAQIYAAPHDHMLWGRGHGERVDATIELARTVPDVLSVGDLSCGNAKIATSLGLTSVWLGDYAPGYLFTGPLEQTIVDLPHVDLYVCSETIEHLDDPGLALGKIRDKTTNLILSTPIGAWDDGNAEHYWAWDREGVELLLTEARFTIQAFTNVDSTAYGEPYNYGIWWAA